MRTILAALTISALSACGGSGGDAPAPQAAPLSVVDAQAQADALQAAYNAQEAAKMHADPRIYNEGTADAASADKKHADPAIYSVDSVDKKHGMPRIVNEGTSQ